jgi:hypothetical protein
MMLSVSHTAQHYMMLSVSHTAQHYMMLSVSYTAQHQMTVSELKAKTLGHAAEVLTT